MEVNRENLLALIRNGVERHKLSISGLERQAGVPKDTVRDFLRGKTQILRADKLQKILRVLEPENKVPISGYVGKDGYIHQADTNDAVDCPPGLDPSDVVALRVESDAMHPVLHEGWTVYYTQKPNAQPPLIRGGWQVPYTKAKGSPGNPDRDSFAEFFGKPCVVKLKNGEMLLRTLKRGSHPRRYNLIGYNTAEIRDAEITMAAKILFIKTE